MAYRTFKLASDADPRQCEAFNAFLRSHAVLAIHREWVPAGEASFWAFCVEYRESGSGGRGVGSAGAAPGKIDYKEILSPEEFVVYAKLRDLRKQLAEKDAVPVFAVFTNEQLAQMVRMPAKSAADLARIDGVGEARVKKYAAAVLALLTASGMGSASGPERNDQKAADHEA